MLFRSLKYGNYQRTGTGLADTTARTSGGYAIRLAPNSTTLFAWPNLVAERSIPTGSIQSKTLTVTAWVYINNAAYYAGTNTRPTLSVKYDNATTATAVATATAGAWQQLAVTITPVTTYGQIEAWISGATDATGSNSYFYIDDVNVGYPAGVAISLGGLDQWAGATPVWPPISTNPSVAGIWDEPTSAHNSAGSFGALMNSRIDAAITSRMVAYTQPTGFLAASFPAAVPDTSSITGALQAAVLPVNVKKVNGVTVKGTGVVGDYWGPV